VAFLAQNSSCSLRSSEETHRTLHHLHRCITSTFFVGNRIRDTSPCRFCSFSYYCTCARVLIFVCRILSGGRFTTRNVWRRGGGKITISLSTRITFKELNHEGFYMGIKPSYIKNLGTELIKKQRENFSKDFEANKQQLGISAVIGSKRVRNRVAGYITRKMNAKQRT